MCQSLTLTQIVSFSGSYPVKVSSLRDFEILSRDMIRILSHAEIFSFAALKCLQSGSMDSMSMVTVQTLGLQQMRLEAAIEFKGSLTSEAKRKLSFAPCTSKLLLTGRLVPFTRRLGLSSTIPCLRGHY